jgi:hypothetical protein
LVRETCQIYPGSILSVVPLGNIVALIPGRSAVEEAAAGLEQMREAAGLSVEDMLEGLEEEREQYYREHYGS